MKQANETTESSLTKEWDNIKISNIIRRYCRPVDKGSAAFCVLCR